uniref:Kinetochore protein SPC25 n=1 Tax=Graphocephala atropunctata TaxID=36148 RepID=A0A1B6L3X6_9HEMI
MEDEFQSAKIMSIVPESLLYVDKALLRQDNLDKCRSLVKKYEEYGMEYEHLNQLCSELRRKKEEQFKKLQFNIENIKKEVYEKENEEKILRNQISAVKQLLLETIPSSDEDELSELIKKVCSLKEGVEHKRKVIRQEVEQYQRGILFYKTYLQCSVICTNKEIFNFTICPTAKSISEASEYIKFITKDGGNSFQYVEMQPKLKIGPSLVKRFLDTKDIQGFILAFWKAVKLLNEKKIRRVLSEKNVL